MCHSGPLSYFQISPFLQERLQSLITPSLSSRISTIFYPQLLLTIFTHNIFTDFHRSSQIFTGLSCHSASIFCSHFLLGTQSPRSSPIFHRSFKDLSKLSFLHPFLLGTWTVGHSGPLSSFPQIFTDLSCHSASIYPLSTRYSVSKIFTYLPQIFQRSFKNFPSSIPFHLDLDSRSFRPTLQISKLFVSPLF